MKKPYLRWPGGPKQSRFSIGVYLFIGIWYFVGFIYAVMQFALHPDLITPFNFFCAGGIISFSLAVGYCGYIQIKLMDFTRRAWLFLFIGGSWGVFSTTLKIYPWNIALALPWLILGLIGCRRSKWELVGEDLAEKEQA